ncbi:hypothetical protein niasHS_001254 [Heterodera schachtii]|uniref:Uncharacterized protein n=2 Tax=Heterodera TaxID=34509 RepID=A0ABD2KHW1_HETSC
MNLLQLFSFVTIINVFSCSNAQLKCRRDTVGTINGVGLKMNFSEEECESTYFWQSSYKYCYASHCLRGNEWLTHYGCAKSPEKGACSDNVEKEMKDLYGLAVSCSFCTIGRKMDDMSNKNFPLYNTTNVVMPSGGADGDDFSFMSTTQQITSSSNLSEIATIVPKKMNLHEMVTSTPIPNYMPILEKSFSKNETKTAPIIEKTYSDDNTSSDNNSCSAFGFGMPMIILNMASLCFSCIFLTHFIQ